MKERAFRLARVGLVTLSLTGASCGIFGEAQKTPNAVTDSGPTEATPKPSEATGTPMPTVDIQAKVRAAVETALAKTKKPTIAKTDATTTGLQKSEVEGVTDHLMKKGDTYVLPRAGLVAGDVSADGVRLYDNNADTGLVVEAGKGTRIGAPFGADVTLLGNNPTNPASQRIEGNIIEWMKASGCGQPTGCSEVDVVKWPGGKPQGQK